jgi:hypothetical protein
MSLKEGDVSIYRPKQTDTELTDLVQHFIAFIEHEALDIAERQLLLANQSVESTWGSDNNVRVRLLVTKEFDVLLHGRASVEDGRLDIRKVLAEPSVLIFDLIS